MSVLEAIVLGIVEGITEYLPISSTGHLILASFLMGLDGRVDKRSLDAFNIVIQGGAILAVLSLYRARVRQMIRGLLGSDAGGRRLVLAVAVAFVPAAGLGFFLDDTIEYYLFSPVPVLAALAVGGVVMILFKGRQGDGPSLDLDRVGVRQALIIGLFQCLALWPGTSRSMVTMIGAMVVGMKPAAAAEFSFILALPTLGAASGYSLAKNLAADGPNMFDLLGAVPVAVGLVASTVSAALAVKWLVSYLTRHGLQIFGWYRIALAMLLGGLIWQGLLTLTALQ